MADEATVAEAIMVDTAVVTVVDMEIEATRTDIVVTVIVVMDITAVMVVVDNTCHI